MINLDTFKDRIVGSWKTTLAGFLILATCLACILIPGVPFGWKECLAPMVLAAILIGLKEHKPKMPKPSQNGQHKPPSRKRPGGGATAAATLLFVMGGLTTSCCTYERCATKYASDTTHTIVYDTIDTTLAVTLPPDTMVARFNIDSLLLLSPKDTVRRQGERQAVDVWKDPKNNTLFVRARTLPVPVMVPVRIPYEKEIYTTQFAPDCEDSFLDNLTFYGFWVALLLLLLFVRWALIRSTR